ncbi:hypothetical protein [Streptomyces griseoaurantiacus]|nr:hypothetical protein [Streptomyces jietaisiensis]
MRTTMPEPRTPQRIAPLLDTIEREDDARGFEPDEQAGGGWTA